MMAATASGSRLCVSAKTAFSLTFGLGSSRSMRRRVSYPRRPRALPNQKDARSRRDSGWLAAKVARVANSVGYASASDLRLHFGLGEEALATEIEVGWPCGRLQK